MKERSILFTPENYRKSNDETKTKTRRIMEHQPSEEATWFGQMRTSGKDDGIWFPMKGDTKDSETWEQAEGKVVKCPYGVPGDHLYVNETWRTFERPKDMVDGILYRIDNAFIPIHNTKEAADLWVDAHKNGKHGDKWRSPRFMFKWMARLWLEILEVNVKRLHDITETDALDEGIKLVSNGVYDGGGPAMGPTAIQAYIRLWESIHGAGSWQLNPWIWDLTYRKVKAS